MRRSPANPDTLVVPLRPHLPEGWYLIYWRAISVDGHPVQGAFTYAVGPEPRPGAAVPGAEHRRTATTAQAAGRALGDVPVGDGRDRPVRAAAADRAAGARARGGSDLRRKLSVAFVVASVVGLLAIPAYLDFATANDSLRSVFDLGALVPLFRVTAFGRAIRRS